MDGITCKLAKNADRQHNVQDSGNVRRHGHYLLTNIPQTKENAKLLIQTLLERLIGKAKLHVGTYDR